jgi:hypothetical protein
MIEDNNNQFLKSRFGNDNGVLYKICGTIGQEGIYDSCLDDTEDGKLY